MIITNHERICRAFIVLRNELKPLVLSALAKADGEHWERRMNDTLRKDDTFYGAGGPSSLDVAALLLLIGIRWQDCISPTYRLGLAPRGYVSELRELRNRWAHQVEFDYESAARAVETAHLLLKAFNGTGSQELVDLRNEIVPPVRVHVPTPRISAGHRVTEPIATRSAESRTDYIGRVSEFLSASLAKSRGSTYSTRDSSIRVVCSISKIHDETGHTRYWFSIQPGQKQFLDPATKGYLAFGCNSIDRIVLMPAEKFNSLLQGLNPTTQDGWHVHMIETSHGLEMILKGGDRIDLNKYVLPSTGDTKQRQ